LGGTITTFMASYWNYPSGHALKILHAIGGFHFVIKIHMNSDAYSYLARTISIRYEQHRQRLNNITNEPLFTNVIRNFIISLNYIFYT
ncbi:hypothetical protein S83_043174, partial [Arachis hypogaea]